jgi:chromosome segregation ATPase
MSTHGETRRKAFDAACALAAEGKRPSMLTVRDRLDGRGGQKAIADGLNDWIDEAARRFAIPGVPEELRGQVVALWDLASRQADGRWDDARGALEARVAEGEAIQAAVRAELAQAAAVIKDHLGAIAELRTALGSMTDARDALDLALEACNSETAALRGDLDTTHAVLEQRTAERDAQALQAQRESQRADVTKDSLDAAHGQILALQVQVGELTTEKALLEQAKTAANAALGPLREDLERVRQAILDRDNQVQALTAALGREQAGREADVQHWLARLEERQAEVTAARARESAWADERQRFQAEVGRLRREVQALRSRAEEIPAAPPGDQG